MTITFKCEAELEAYYAIGEFLASLSELFSLSVSSEEEVEEMFKRINGLKSFDVELDFELGPIKEI